jgi:hypothetical protein
MNAPAAAIPVSDEPAACEPHGCPPALPFVFSAGVTGHRGDAIPEGSVEALTERLRSVLAKLADAAAAVHREEAEFFSAEPARLLFVSPLADGADQIAAEAALDLGFELHAILPFEREQYRRELGDAARERFDALLARAACVLELPGQEEHRLEAYVMAGRATIAHCDVLVAVWDGLPPRGRGGTGEIVELAMMRGVPTVHVPVEERAPTELRWSAFDPAVITSPSDSESIRPFDDGEVEAVLRALLAPPPDANERRFLNQFQRECHRRLRLRIEYPLLLTAAGVSRIKKHHWRGDLALAYIREEWDRYRDAFSRVQTVNAPLDQLQRWYEWPDALAGHFAQSYRSGHVFNFVLGAVAVLLALSALIVPDAKKFLAMAEFAVILAILVNTHVGTRQEWHRRWLDYRQLAERLRPMRALKLLGIAAPDSPGSAAYPVAARWIDWYAAAVWRAAACPTGQIDAGKVTKLSKTIAEHELEPQIAYHHSTARQGERLDHRLELLGLGAFAATLLACAVLLVALFVDKHWVMDNLGWFTLLTAGLPAIGTAVFGIRVQGDYAAGSVRSEQTARVLEQIAEGMTHKPVKLGRIADLVEQAARTMLLDLDEWRLLNQQHVLTI